MSLSRNPRAGDGTEDRHPVVTDAVGPVYFIDKQIDLSECNNANDIALSWVSDVVNMFNEVDLGNNTMGRLRIANDLVMKDPPTGRASKRVYYRLNNDIAAAEFRFVVSEGGPFQVVPRGIEGQRQVFYIWGKSGSGKSTWAANYAQTYLENNAGGTVYLISIKPMDPVFDVIPGLKRITLDDSFVLKYTNETSDQILQGFRNSLVIFDDFSWIDDKSILKLLTLIKGLVLEVGRSFNIDVISISHKAKAGSKTLIEFTEADYFVCFPKSTNLGEIAGVFKTYLSFSKDQTAQALDDLGKNARWMCVLRPNIIITPTYIKIIPR